MKRIIWFFPYFLTNIMAALFFTMWCFLAKDSYFTPFLRTAFYQFSWLLLFLLVFSMPKFLIKGEVPEPFKKGQKAGYWFVIKAVLFSSIGFFMLTFYAPPERILSLYTVGMWSMFFFTIYAHYRWKKSSKKHIADPKM